MSKYAKSIEEALDLLKGSATVADDDEELEEVEEGDEIVEVEGDADDDDDDDDTDKGEVIDIKKAEDDEDLVELVKADDFMVSLMQNQDQNVELLANRLNRNTKASSKIADVLKSLADDMAEIKTVVTSLAGQPLPRKSVLTKAEADRLKKASASKPDIQNDPTEESDGVSITKADIIRVVSAAAKAGKCPVQDVVKAESSMASADIDAAGLVNCLSVGGRDAIAEYLSSVE